MVKVKVIGQGKWPQNERVLFRLKVKVNLGKTVQLKSGPELETANNNISRKVVGATSSWAAVDR